MSRFRRRALLEPKIKAALIDRLMVQGELQGDAVLIPEMPVDGWSRRVDLVVANGRLHAFEIKSDADSLDRLAGQIAVYDRLFDKVTVVCGARLAAAVFQETPDHVGVLLAEPNGAGLSFREIRRGRAIPNTDPRALLILLWRKEIEELLRSRGIKPPANAFRANLETLAMALPVSTLRSAALAAIKKRYRSSCQAFLKGYCGRTSPKDLRRLTRRRGTQVKAPQKCVAASVQTWHWRRPAIEAHPLAKRLDLGAIKSNLGALPSDMPRLVLRRLAKGQIG